MVAQNNNMFFEILHILCFITLGLIAGIHISYYKYVKEHHKKFSYSQYAIFLGMAFAVVILLGYVNQRISVSDILAISSVLLAILAFIISYKISAGKRIRRNERYPLREKE